MSTRAKDGRVGRGRLTGVDQRASKETEEGEEEDDNAGHHSAELKVEWSKESEE